MISLKRLIIKGYVNNAKNVMLSLIFQNPSIVVILSMTLIQMDNISLQQIRPRGACPS